MSCFVLSGTWVRCGLGGSRCWTTPRSRCWWRRSATHPARSSVRTIRAWRNWDEPSCSRSDNFQATNTAATAEHPVTAFTFTHRVFPAHCYFEFELRFLRPTGHKSRSFWRRSSLAFSWHSTEAHIIIVLLPSWIERRYSGGILANVCLRHFLTGGEVLAWLSVWNKVQMICIWSSWWHCHPVISCSSKIQNGLCFWCQLTLVVLEKKLLNGCSS